MKKKNLWMTGIAALAITACSKVDVVKEGAISQVRAIHFDTHINKSTKAVDNDNFSTFFVYGSYTAPNAVNTHYTIFNGVDAVTSSNGSAGPWTYPNQRYWIPGANYRFYACSNDNGAIAAEEGTVAFSGGNLNINGYLCDELHQKDLVFAGLVKQTGAESNNPSVTLNFKHILSRLTFIFSTTFPEDNKIEISNFKVSNIRNKGNFNAANENQSDDQWTGVDRSITAPEVKPLFAGKGTVICQNKTDGKVTSDFVYVIPFKYNEANVSVIFNITVKNKDDQTILERTLKSSWAPKWEIGKSYTYNVTINGSAAGVEPIKFEVGSISDWEKGDPTMPNIGVDGGKQPGKTNP